MIDLKSNIIAEAIEMRSDWMELTGGVQSIGLTNERINEFQIFIKVMIILESVGDISK